MFGALSHDPHRGRPAFLVRVQNDPCFGLRSRQIDDLMYPADLIAVFAKRDRDEVMGLEKRPEIALGSPRGALDCRHDPTVEEDLDMIHPWVHRELDSLDPGYQPQEKGNKGHHDQLRPQSLRRTPSGVG